MTNLVGIPSDALTDMWPIVEPMIQKACAGSNGRFKPGDIAKAIAERDFQLWVALRAQGPQAMAVTRIVKFPQVTVCEVLACVGEDREDWVDHLSTIEAWAVSQGAKQMHSIARTGWARVLKPHGYKQSHVLLEKTL